MLCIVLVISWGSQPAPFGSVLVWVLAQVVSRQFYGVMVFIIICYKIDGARRIPQLSESQLIFFEHRQLLESWAVTAFMMTTTLEFIRKGYRPVVLKFQPPFSIVSFFFFFVYGFRLVLFLLPSFFSSLLEISVFPASTSKLDKFSWSGWTEVKLSTLQICVFPIFEVGLWRIFEYCHIVRGM